MADFIIVNSLRGKLPRAEPTEEQKKNNQLGTLTGEPAELYRRGEENDYLAIEKPSDEELDKLKAAGAIYFPDKPKRTRRRRVVEEEDVEGESGESAPASKGKGSKAS